MLTRHTPISNHTKAHGRCTAAAADRRLRFARTNQRQAQAADQQHDVAAMWSNFEGDQAFPCLVSP